MKANILLALFIVMFVGIVAWDVKTDHDKKQAKITNDGCPPIGTKVGWVDRELTVTKHSGIPNFVYAHETGYYGSSLYDCGMLRILVEQK